MAPSQSDERKEQPRWTQISSFSHLLDQVFAALRLSLTVATQHGFLAILFFSIAVVVVTLFLKDRPLAKSWNEVGAQTAKPPLLPRKT